MSGVRICFRGKKVLESCKGMDLRLFLVGSRDLRVEDVARDQGEAVGDQLRSRTVQWRGCVVLGEVVVQA